MATRDVVGLLFATTSEKPANLSGKDLRNLDLAGIDFKRANLKDAFLFGTDLRGAKLSGCDLEGANLGRATPWRRSGKRTRN
ncbi:MAG: pentapeptide repeat-containing protein [Hyphomicrobium denitrificans]|nr:pentapeptide repeat-containing protein [Hyphomicrobium denitrificans]